MEIPGLETEQYELDYENKDIGISEINGEYELISLKNITNITNHFKDYPVNITFLKVIIDDYKAYVNLQDLRINKTSLLKYSKHITYKERMKCYIEICFIISKFVDEYEHKDTAFFPDFSKIYMNRVNNEINIFIDPSFSLRGYNYRLISIDRIISSVFNDSDHINHIRKFSEYYMKNTFKNTKRSKDIFRHYVKFLLKKYYS